MNELHEIFIQPDGHKRCTGCGEIIFNMTDDHLLICPDSFLDDISERHLTERLQPGRAAERYVSRLQGVCG